MNKENESKKHSSEELSKDSSEIKLDSEVEEMLRRSKEIVDIMNTDYKKVCEGLQMTPDELKNLLEDTEAMDDEELEIIEKDKQEFKQNVERLLGEDAAKVMLESIANEKGGQDKKRVVKKARRNWINVK
jgi:uncharacterized membrane-anchored protein YhcB (DUF1043 family)